MDWCLDCEWNENEWKIPLHTYHGVVFFSIHELPGEAVKGVWDLAESTDGTHAPHSGAADLLSVHVENQISVITYSCL
jgi:hypothetical protein